MKKLLPAEKIRRKVSVFDINIVPWFVRSQICDKGGETCDKLCGGAGCGFCGGLSCEAGAITKAERAYSFAKQAEKHIRDKEAKSEELYRGVSSIIVQVFLLFFFGLRY